MHLPKYWKKGHGFTKRRKGPLNFKYHSVHKAAHTSAQSTWAPHLYTPCSPKPLWFGSLQTVPSLWNDCIPNLEFSGQLSRQNPKHTVNSKMVTQHWPISQFVWLEGLTGTEDLNVLHLSTAHLTSGAVSRTLSLSFFSHPQPFSWKDSSAPLSPHLCPHFHTGCHHPGVEDIPTPGREGLSYQPPNWPGATLTSDTKPQQTTPISGNHKNANSLKAPTHSLNLISTTFPSPTGLVRYLMTLCKDMSL